MGYLTNVATATDRAWRLCATALCFALYGIGGVLWGLLLPPLSRLLGSGRLRQRRSRLAMHWVLRGFIAVMRITGLMTHRIDDLERLNRPGRLVIANHPSLIDVVLLISMIRNATCIVKPTLAQNPFLGPPVEAMRYLYAEDPETLMARCAEELQAGATLIVFPEGTRSLPDRMLRFQRGVANIALYAGVPILPVYIHCRPSWLTRQHRWHYVPPTRVSYRFHVGQEIDPVVYREAAGRSIAARRLTRDLQDHFLAQERLHA